MAERKMLPRRLCLVISQKWSSGLTWGKRQETGLLIHGNVKTIFEQTKQ